MTFSPHQQLAELLILKSVCGLEPFEQQQLDRLQRENKVSESELQNEMDRIELAAAAADLASFSSDSDTMPEHLKDCVLVEAGKFFESHSDQMDYESSSDPVTRYQANDSGVNGWMISTIIATAACILLLLNAMNADKTPPKEKTLSVAQKMERFLASSPSDLMDVEMVPGFDATGKGITNGRIVWSDTLQEGYMDFTGLAINNPKDDVYQLWIIDPNQKIPVDGGVFNITGKRQIIPIDAKLRATANNFAVTVEIPPGVPESDQSRIATADAQLAEILAANLAKEKAEQDANAPSGENRDSASDGAKK